MIEFLTYYLLGCIVIIIWMVSDIKYYEIRDTLKHYDTIHEYIERLDEKLSKVDKDDIEKFERLANEKSYWMMLDKNKKKVKWMIRIKNVFMK